MEDTLLIDAAERFVNGEMSTEEKIYFEDLRKNNPELDQAVVEQLFFLNQLDNYSKAKSFRSLLSDVENKLSEESFLSRTVSERTSKIVQLWQRYKKDIAVAASIAGLVSLLIATAISTVTTGEKTNIKPLVDKIDDQAEKTRKIENKLNEIVKSGVVAQKVKPSFDSRFRATGFMIDAANNYIVTNAHVIKEASHHLIVENNYGEQYNASTVYVDIVNDMAILKITDTSFKRLPSLPYSIRKTGAKLGESIFMLGYPKQEIVYGEGYVSAKNGYLMDTVFCQISTAANEGNSGSPVITKNGDLVGIVTSTETNANGVVYAIKSANIYLAIEAVKKIRDNEKIKIISAPSLKGLDRPGQVEKMQDYVFMIKGN
ncbi:MAG: serine protease [Ferruginibacter sp.]